MPADAIQFNNIPGSGLVAPIFTAEFNSGGQYTTVDRFILVGHIATGGTMAPYTPTPVSSQQQVDLLCGKNSMLREMARIAFQNAPALPLWIMGVSDAGLTAPVITMTISTLPAPGVGQVQVQGETLQINVASTDTTTTVAANLAAAISSYYNPLTGAMLPGTATSAANVVTFTSANKGAIFNEIDIHLPTTSNNVLAVAGVVAVAFSVTGAGTPTDIAGALALLGDNPADFVVCPWTDATSLAAYTAWSNDVSGRWAWNRQSYGHVWSAARASFSGLTTLGLGLNDRHLTVMGCLTPGTQNTPHPSYLWIAAAAARLFPWLTDVSDGNIARAHDGLVLQGISPPRDPSVWPNYTARNVLNSSGISTWRVNADGSVALSKVITTYQTGTAGNPDSVFRDIQAMYQCSEGMKYMRAELAVLFSQKAIVKVNPSSLAAAVTPADIKAGFVAIYAELCANLVFQDADTYASLVEVRPNPNNPNRIDVFSPMERVNPLDILATNATIYQQYPNTALLPPLAAAA